MPSSDPTTIPKVLSVMLAIQPRSILDVGAGNGRYGFLLRECLDWNYGRLQRKKWQVTIDGLDVEMDYLNPVHDFVYNIFDLGDWLEHELPEAGYDVIFMGDVLEHFERWRDALIKALRFSKFTIVVSPNWKGSIQQGAWNGYEGEVHRVVLSPSMVGGQCLFCNSKMFMCVFDNENTGLLDDKSLCL